MIRPSVRPFLAGLVVCAAALTLAVRVTTAPGPASWADDLAPISKADWNADRAAHLIERAGFGATPEDIDRLAALTPEQAVAQLVNYESIDNSALKPFDESGIWDAGMDPFPPSRAEAVRLARERGEGLGEKMLPPGSPRRLQPIVDKFFYGLYANQIETQRLGLWWANRMLATPRPLEEKLTLFWHGHFATGENKVRDYRMMLQQNRMLRANASGRLQDLLIGILKDPAMLVYLDNGENVKSHPNENFGRELLELFSMGVGNYTEHDVREAARAFTGWTNDVLTYKFDAAQHDFGEKTFLGQKGPFNGDDIIRIILEQPVTGEFVAAKIYRYFVREDISPAVKTQLGREFRQSGYQIKPLMTRILLSKDFYSPASYATQIKSPAHLVVSTYRKMGLREVPTVPDFGRMTGWPRPVAVRSAQRRGLGRRPYLDHAGHAAATRQHVPRRALPGHQELPSAGPRDVGHRSARRRAPREGHEHHRSDARRRRRVEQDGRSRRGLQHAIRRMGRLSDRVQAHEADPAAADLDRSRRDGRGGAGRHARQGRGPFPPPLHARLAGGQRSSGPRGLSEDQAHGRRLTARAAVSGAEYAGVSAWLVVSGWWLVVSGWRIEDRHG